MTPRWRTGRKVGRTIYLQLGPEPSDYDVLYGVMDTPELAAAAVRGLNRFAAEGVLDLDDVDPMDKSTPTVTAASVLEYQCPWCGETGHRAQRGERGGLVLPPGHVPADEDEQRKHARFGELIVLCWAAAGDTQPKRFKLVLR